MTGIGSRVVNPIQPVPITAERPKIGNIPINEHRCNPLEQQLRVPAQKTNAEKPKAGFSPGRIAERRERNRHVPGRVVVAGVFFTDVTQRLGSRFPKGQPYTRRIFPLNKPAQ